MHSAFCQGADRLRVWEKRKLLLGGGKIPVMRQEFPRFEAWPGSIEGGMWKLEVMMESLLKLFLKL